MSTDKFKGYILGAIAAATYGMNPLFALPLYSHGMDADSVLLFRYLGATVMVGLMLKLRGWSFRVKPRVLAELFVLGLLMALSSLGLFASYNYMAAGIASTMLFVYPIMVAILMAIAFRERISSLTWTCLVMATLGIILLYKGEDGATLSLTGTILVMLSALFYAIYIVAINRKELKGLPTLIVTFYILLFGIIVFAGRLFMAGSVSMPDEGWLWLNVIALALFPTVISFICTTRAIHFVGSTVTAILGSLEPVTAIVFGITVFGEQLTARDYLGLTVIITAVTLVVSGGRISLPLTRFRKLFRRRR